MLPFAAFMAVLVLRGALPDAGGGLVDGRWLYALQAGAAALLLAWGWRRFEELGAAAWSGIGARELLLAVAVGAVVWALWISLDAPWMRLGEPTAAFRPLDADGQMMWGLIALRALGATLVVPLMEELFWRSLLMRWLHGTPFHQVDPGRVGARAMLLSSAVFALAHTEWLAAFITGIAYAWLYRRTGSLWVPVIAHAVTNGLLAIWVVAGGHWAYW
jgi:uncharacterized protein